MLKKTWKVLLSTVSFILISITVCYAADKLLGDIPLQNPGFENGLSNWNPGKFKNQVSLVDRPVRSGSAAIKVDASDVPNMPYVSTVAKALESGATYQFSVWARVAPGSPAVEAAVKIENYNDAGKNTSGVYGRTSLPSDGTWKQITVTGQSDTDTTRSNLLLRVFGKSTVIFDDAAFVRITEAPGVTIVNPRQIAIEPNKATRLTYSLYFNQPWMEQNLPEITVKVRPLGAQADSSEAGLIRTASTRSDSQHFNVTFALPELAPGDYAVDFGYQRDGKFLETATSGFIFTTVENRKPKYLTDQGTIIWKGKPFFPIGMFHVSSQDYKLLADHGFNAVQGIATLNIDEFKKSLDEAEKYGLAVDVPLYADGQVKKNLANSLEKIRKFADHPAVLCWKIKDEPDIVSNAEFAAEVPAVYRALKQADPDRPLELTLANDETLSFWSNFCDIMQIDRYPVRSATGSSDLTPVASFTHNAKSVLQPWQNLTFDVQSGWTLDLATQPTVPQARSMVYLALINGAKGIFWYSMSEKSGWDLTKTPFWPYMKQINAEIKAISEPILIGDTVPVQIDNPLVYVTGRKYQDKVYIYFTNPTAQEISTIFNLTDLPSVAAGEFVKSAFIPSDEKITVKHAPGGLSNINLKLEPLQSGTMVFNRLKE